jgi:hypothetical protein
VRFLEDAAVRNYLNDARRERSLSIETVRTRFPTAGSANRFGAILICEKEGFDDLLQARHVPERYDIALMSTKGISAKAARQLAQSCQVPCFTLHDMDKNGFVMAAGFPFATDLGLRMNDVEEWGLQAEEQEHPNQTATYRNLRKNGATDEEATFISNGQRVELNMLTGPDFIEFVEKKLETNGVAKVVPDAGTLKAAWRRAALAARINNTIHEMQEESEKADGPAIPDDLEQQIRQRLEEEPRDAWDDVVYILAGGAVDDEDDRDEDEDIDDFEFPDEDW